MKRCSICNRVYGEQALKFCRADGTPLVSNSSIEAETIFFPTERISNSPPKLLPETTRSIAVLPFQNLTADPANEYFCEGLAEELVHALSRIENLTVAARTSAFSFKGKDAGLRDIGKALNVEAVLEGSIRKSGNRMRITVQLVSAKTGYQLYSERYDCEMCDTLQVHSEIKRAVVTALEVKLGAHEPATLFRQHTENAKARELYLMGRFHASRFTAEGFRAGVEYLNQAVAEDPNYALAYAGLAEAYYHASSVHLRPAEAMVQVKAAAEKALELDKNLAEAHTLLAVVAANFDRMPQQAETGFKRALEIAPKNVLAHQWYGCYLITQGRLAAAIGEFCRAQDLDPLSPVLSVLTSVTHFFARQPYKALREARKAISMDENFWFGYWSAALAHEQMGQLVEALGQLERAEECGSSPWITAVRARVYSKLGRRDIVEAILRDVTDTTKTQWVAPYLIASVYFALDEKERGFEWLEKAFADYDEALSFMTVDPLLDPYRTDPHFMDLLRRAALEQSYAKTHVVTTVSGEYIAAGNCSGSWAASSLVPYS